MSACFQGLNLTSFINSMFLLTFNNVACLLITPVAISHGGKYSCQAENEAGRQKCEATLTVQGQVTSFLKILILASMSSPAHTHPVCIPEPARVVEPAASISVTAGDSATLECTISGSPDLKVKCNTQRLVEMMWAYF
uniref:Ig-like domain-containing protein n=1 Tax=Mola mola TaxID=94237 RepID=A0A3Q3XA73_MOLML